MPKLYLPLDTGPTHAGRKADAREELGRSAPTPPKPTARWPARPAGTTAKSDPYRFAARPTPRGTRPPRQSARLAIHPDAAETQRPDRQLDRTAGQPSRPVPLGHSTDPRGTPADAAPTVRATGRPRLTPPKARAAPQPDRPTWDTTDAAPTVRAIGRPRLTPPKARADRQVNRPTVASAQTDLALELRRTTWRTPPTPRAGRRLDLAHVAAAQADLAIELRRPTWDIATTAPTLGGRLTWTPPNTSGHARPLVRPTSTPPNPTLAVNLRRPTWDTAATAPTLGKIGRPTSPPPETHGPLASSTDRRRQPS